MPLDAIAPVFNAELFQQTDGAAGEHIGQGGKHARQVGEWLRQHYHVLAQLWRIVQAATSLIAKGTGQGKFDRPSWERDAFWSAGGAAGQHFNAHLRAGRPELAMRTNLTAWQYARPLPVCAAKLYAKRAY